jgi:DNA-binding NtrC family response regulator/tetratricopeptide (TPR) repeat protein/transposase
MNSFFAIFVASLGWTGKWQKYPLPFRLDEKLFLTARKDHRKKTTGKPRSFCGRRPGEKSAMFQPLFVRPVMASEKEALLQCVRSANPEEASRAEIILLSSEGKTASEISQSLGYHPSNVKKWIRKFNEAGVKGIVARKRGPQGGPKPRFTTGQFEKIIEMAGTDPATLGLPFKIWTPQKLATVVTERGIVERISDVTVRQLLKRHQADAARGSMSKSATGGPRPASHLQLGREELSRSRYERAVEHFAAALSEGCGSSEEEALTRAYLSEALEELSKYEEAYAAIGKYEESHNVLSLSSQTRARLRLRIGWVNSWLKKFPKAIASLNEAMKLFLELQDDLGVSEANYAIGHTYFRINEFRIARDYLMSAARSQKSRVDRELLARIYDRLGAVDFYEGAFSNAKENYLKALDLAEGCSNTNLLGMILLNLGTACDEGFLGEWDEGARYEKRAIEYLEIGGHKDHLALAYNNLGENLRCAGLWDEAREKLEMAIGISQKYGKPDYETTARITISEILCARGEYSEAEMHLDRSLDLIDGKADKWLYSARLRILASLQRGTGRIDAALKTMREALAVSTSIGDMNGVALAQAGLAEFHFLQGRCDQAREYLELARGRLKDEKSLSISGLVQRLMGQLEAASAHLTEARQHIAQSISIFTTTAIPYEEARSHYEMGILLKQARDLRAAEASLEQAEAIFERLGAQPSLALCRKALSSMDSSEDTWAEVVRVNPPSDVMLMQRLIEASKSRDLLVKELAAVIIDNFPAEQVLICRGDEGGRVQVLAAQGLDRHEADKLCEKICNAPPDKIASADSSYLVRLGNGDGSPVTLYIKGRQAIDIGRLQPLLKQAELGFETCSLRAAARGAAAPSLEHRIQTVMPGFIVGSAAMFDVVEKIHKIRTSDVTVLITGESGTGKELIARAIHVGSARARAIFLPFNCTATPKDIIDSHLFGHRRGAFTGATANYPGIIKASDGGTLFLDEIGDLSLEVQPKLMRFLQEGEIQTLGETRPLRVDVRILAATNTDLERAVEDGRFREDLFHRLNIIRIHVPPLRDRREEVPVLAAHFFEQLSNRSGKTGMSLTQQAIGALQAYDWPGNVRQLRNEIERAVAYASEGMALGADDFSPDVAHPRRQASSGPSRPSVYQMNGLNGGGRYSATSGGGYGRRESGGQQKVKLKEATAALERQIISEALIRNKSNLSRTALDLGLSRRGLRLKLAQLGIEKEGQL